MNCLSRIIPKYTYNYFDAYDQLQTKQLNGFQYLLRRIFGCYAETHLFNVVKKAYTVTLNDRFPASYKKGQKLLELISKAQAFKRFPNMDGVRLPSFKLNGEKVTTKVKYEIRDPKDATDNYKISSIQFRLVFQGSKNEYSMWFFKNKLQQIVVTLPGIFAGYSDTIEQMKTSKRRETINGLLAKILNDSSCAMTQIQYYPDDRNILPRHRSWDPLGELDQKGSQDRNMNELGWQHLTNFSENNLLKREYSLTGEVAAKNRSLADLGFNQQISTAFAVSFLETKARLY